MKRFLVLLAGISLATTAHAQCYKNGVPCGQVISSSSGQTSTNVVSLPPLPTGNNSIGSISNTTFGASQIGTWHLGLDPGTNAIGSITNSSFGATQQGTWSVNLTGALPGFSTPPTVNLGSTNGLATDAAVRSLTIALGTPYQQGGAIPLPAGAATDNSLQTINTTLGSPFQSGASIGNTQFGASQYGPWVVSLDAGTKTIGAISNTQFSTTQSGQWTVGLSSGTNTVGSISNTSFGAAQLGQWNVGLNAGSAVIGSIANTGFSITGSLPGFATAPTVNLGTLNGAATAGNQTSEINNLTTLSSTVTAAGSTQPSNGIYALGSDGTYARPLSLTSSGILNIQGSVNSLPTASASNAIQGVTVSSTSSNVFKTTSGNLYSINAENSSTAGFILALDANAVPTSGSTLTVSALRYHFNIAATGSLDKTFAMPMAFSTGIVVLCSSSITTYTPITCTLITAQYK